jgi:hypothetical protein
MADSLFRSAGFEVPEAASGGGGLFAKAGFALPGTATAPTLPDWAKAAGAVESIMVPGSAPRYFDRKGAIISAPDENQGPGAATPVRNLVDFISNLSPNFDRAQLQNYQSGNALAAAGRQERAAGQGFPSFPSIDPATWSPGGYLKTGFGHAGAVLAPVSALVQTLVEDPVTKISGNPEAGARAGFVVDAALPGPGAIFARKLAKSTMPESRAVNALVYAAGPENIPAAVARMKDNPRLALMDVSDPVRTMAQGLIDPAQPKAQTVLTNAVKTRMKEAPDVVNSAYTQAMGPAPDVVKLVGELKESARKAGREAIEPAVKNAKPVDVQPVITAIDEKLKPGITAMLDPGTRLPLSEIDQELLRLKSHLTDGKNVLFDAKKLHEIQSNIGDQAFQLSKSSDAKQRMLGHQLRDFNEKLIDQIDVASGGAYRPARANFKDAKDIHEAFDSGFDTLKNRSGVSGLGDRPEAFQAWMKAATPEEIAARRLGTRADIDQKINSVKNPALAGTDITKIEYNREKLAMLFGDKEAGRLIRRMEDASDQAVTNAKLIANSKTAETLAAQKAMEVRQVGGGNPLQYVAPVAAELVGQGAGLPGVGAGSAIALGLAHRGAQFIGKKSDLSRNVRIARGASATDASRDALIRQLMAHPAVVRQAKKSRNALSP